MNPQSEAIREQQKKSWNQFSAGWKKWDKLTMDFIHPIGMEIISLIKPSGTDRVLDVATGTGEPGISIAGQLKGGMVVLTDLAEDMLALARENAAKKGITNIETKVCDAGELPFADNSFDAISCRFGFMFFPEMHLAAKEMVRVLKPGGRIATSVWDLPEKNFWVTAIMGVINKNMEIPSPAPGSPGMFRCARPGLMVDLFQEAGFKNVLQKEITFKTSWDDVDTYWNMSTEVGAPFVAALSRADKPLRKKIKDQVYELIAEKYPRGKLSMLANALVIAGEK